MTLFSLLSIVRESSLTSWHSQLYAGLLFLLQTAAIVVTSQVELLTNLPDVIFRFPPEPEAAVYNWPPAADMSHIGALQESSCACPRGKAGNYRWTGHLSFTPCHLPDDIRDAYAGGQPHEL